MAKKIHYIQSDESDDAIVRMMSEKNVETHVASLFVRAPDQQAGKEMVNAARLCACNTVCRFWIEEE